MTSTPQQRYGAFGPAAGDDGSWQGISRTTKFQSACECKGQQNEYFMEIILGNSTISTACSAYRICCTCVMGELFIHFSVRCQSKQDSFFRTDRWNKCDALVSTLSAMCVEIGFHSLSIAHVTAHVLVEELSLGNIVRYHSIVDDALQCPRIHGRANRQR